MIETRLLQYFLAVAEEQNFTKAAEYLHITQPTLSKQMMDLERELGKQLFIRGHKRITLTDDGIYLRSKAQEIVSLLEKTENAFRHCETDISGDVTIGLGEFHSLLPMMKMMSSLHEEYPDIHFHLHSGNWSAILKMLDKGCVDFGFLIDPEISSRYDYLKLPLQERWGVLMLKDDPLAAKPVLHLEDLEGSTLIVPESHFRHSGLKEYVARQGLDHNIAATFNLIYNAALLVQSGFGKALCIGNLAGLPFDPNLVHVPLDPPILSDIYLVSKKYQTFSKAAHLFYDRLLQELPFESQP